MVGGRYDVGGKSGSPQAGQMAGATDGSSRTFRASAWLGPGSTSTGFTLSLGRAAPVAALVDAGIGIGWMVCCFGVGFVSPGKGGKLDKSTVGVAIGSGSSSEGL